MSNNFTQIVKSFVKTGKEAERAFVNIINNENVEWSSEEEDMKKHFDFTIPLRFDVKGLKKIRRSDSEVNEHFHYLEIKNVNGDTGWLYAEDVHFFVFELKGYWIVAQKEDLQNFVKTNIEKIYTQKPELYKLYQRSGRKDIITQITSYDLCYLSTKIIKK